MPLGCTGDDGRRRPRCCVALASPVTVGALALLVLNDHLLKQAWPGPVTGKLSDLAGLVVAPFLVALPLVVLRVRRPVPVAIVVTAVLFTLVKATDAGSDVASAAWSAVAGLSLVRRDPTDLLALPALLVAARVHRLARVARPAGRRSARRWSGRSCCPSWWWRRRRPGSASRAEAPRTSGWSAGR